MLNFKIYIYIYNLERLNIDLKNPVACLLSNSSSCTPNCCQKSFIEHMLSRILHL